MAQYHLHENLSPNASPAIPFLLDLQCPLLSGLRTRIVAPVYRRSSLGGSIPSELGIEFLVNNEPCVALLPEMASIPEKYLGAAQHDLSAMRNLWIRGVDLIFTGM